MTTTLLIQQVLNGLLDGVYYLLIALGLSLIFSLGGIVNLAHGGFFTLGANLAVVLARRGARVLLGDFDFRNPALAEVFGLPERSPGALQVAAGSANLDESLWSVSLDGCTRSDPAMYASRASAVNDEMTTSGNVGTAVRSTPGISNEIASISSTSADAPATTVTEA